MTKRNTIQVLIIAFVLLFSLQQAPAINERLTNDDLTTETIAGISYSYGQRTYSESGNVTYTTNATVQESYSQSRTGVTNMPLITDYNLENFYYELFFTNSSSTSNRTRSSWVDQTGLESVINYINTTVPLKFNLTNIEDGRAQMNISIIEGFQLIETAVVSSEGEFLGQYPQNATFIEFLDKDQGDIIRRTLVINPRVMVIDLITELHEVFYNQTEIALAYMGFYNEYSMTYNLSASAYQVNISDGENFGLTVGMFDRIDAEYEETSINVLFYSLFAASFTEIQFSEDGQTGNGTVVTDNGFAIPFSLLPVVYSAQGTQVQAGYRHVSSSIISTYQSVVAGFLTRANETAENMNETSLSARLAIWGLSTSTTMIAFNDGNDNGRLDLALDQEGLYVKSSDQVEAIGLAEAYETNVTNAYYQSHVYNQSVEYLGTGIKLNETNVNRTNFVYNTASYGFGDVSSDVTSTFVWNEPVQREDGNIEFNFGMNYTDFPVTWVNMTDGSSVTDSEDIAYHYKVVVNPEEGSARISPTWIYGGISDAFLKGQTDGLSLALLVRSEFFALQATYTATQSADPVNSTRTTTFSRLFVQIGGKNSTDIDTTGPKQFYLSGDQNYTANFDAIRILTVAGSFSGERVSPFSSESENSASDSTTASLVERLDVGFIYSVDLLVVSYPNWSGKDIIHDPDYNMNYQARPGEVSSEESSTPETSSSTDSSSTTEETTSSSQISNTNENSGSSTISSSTPQTSSENAETSGFGISISILAITSFLLLRVVTLRKSKIKI